MPFLLAAGVSAAIATVAWILRALSVRGALAALAVGTLILWPTGWPGCAVLGTFFVGSTLVSRIAARAAGPSDQADTQTRDERQVFANGGLAAFGATAEWIAPGLGFWLATVALAASGADTWATAFGSLSPRPPRDILTRRPVPAGTSGGVTWFGSSGGFMGAASVGLVAVTMGGPGPLLLAAAFIGQAAMLFDSVLGSAWQAGFHCARCDLPTERRIHRCGARTTLTRGRAWLDNDGVNALAGGAALVLGIVSWWLA
ncbi:MAG: DUF92 domain-containing protein [Gemmatimonadetes bacterium]|nr:DUF92 domain-containing protein [Gemmatimonadota bacterium]